MYNLPAFDMNKAVLAPSSRGLGHRPFKARTPVRIRLGLPELQPTLVVGFNFAQSAPTGCASVPTENAVFVGNAHRHAWRIREYTIRKILKNRPREIFLILFIAYRGAMLGLPKIKTTHLGGFCWCSVYYIFRIVSVFIFLTNISSCDTSNIPPVY